MSTNLATRMLIEPLRSLAFGSISETYMGIGTAFAHPVRILRLQNETDAALFISDDGTTDKLYLPPHTFFLLDITTNRSEPSGSMYFGQGARFYVKGSPTMGSVYLEILYGVTP